MKATTVNALVIGLFSIWLLLLLPWMIVAPLSGMAFDAGYTARAYIVTCSFLSYPLSVILAGLLARKRPLLVLLPCVNFIGVFSDLLWKSN